MKDSQSHPWLKIDPREGGWLDGVSLDAFTLWWALELYQARTGGTALVPKTKLHVATSRRMPPRRIDTAVAELIAEGQLVDHGDAIELAVWEQPPVEVWQDDVLRRRWTRNNRLKKMTELREFVKTRDRSLCGYCGVRVNWADKKGHDGATYDHVDPDGDNTRENLRVACRRCNGRKRDRTPAQAGMSLYRPGTTAEQIAAGAAPLLAAPTATGPIPDRARGGGPPPRAHTDLDPTQVRPGSGARSARARTRDRTDPVPTQVAARLGEQPRSPRPDDGSVPRLRQTGGAIRLHPDDPAHPNHHQSEE